MRPSPLRFRPLQQNVQCPIACHREPGYEYSERHVATLQPSYDLVTEVSNSQPCCSLGVDEGQAPDQR